jgi:hypothetical protein
VHKGDRANVVTSREKKEKSSSMDPNWRELMAAWGNDNGKYGRGVLIVD